MTQATHILTRPIGREGRTTPARAARTGRRMANEDPAAILRTPVAYHRVSARQERAAGIVVGVLAGSAASWLGALAWLLAGGAA